MQNTDDSTLGMQKDRRAFWNPGIHWEIGSENALSSDCYPIVVPLSVSFGFAKSTFFVILASLSLIGADADGTLP